MRLADITAGQRVEGLVLLATSREERTTKQRQPYVVIGLRDATGVIEGRLWSSRLSSAGQWDTGQCVRVYGEVKEWAGKLQLNINTIEPALDVEPRDFLPRSKRNPEEMLGRLLALVDTLREPLNQLVRRVLLHGEEDLGLNDAPAASSNHRAYLGGLLEHTLLVAELADTIGPIFRAAGVDRDLLVAGAVLHDIGKCRELTVDQGIEYSTEGRLLGHVFLGAQVVDVMRDYEDTRGEPGIGLLFHIILSHHGQLEWGAPVLPQTPEAVLLHEIDHLVSRMEMVEEARAGAADNGWTEWVKPLGRRLYFAPNPRCAWTCPHGDRCTLEAGHVGGHNHRGCDCNAPNLPTPSDEILF